MDYFAELQEGSPFTTSGWKWIPGYTIKTGGNYNLSEYANTFVNLGHLNERRFSATWWTSKTASSRTPKTSESTPWNGATARKFPFSVNVNAYYTDWQNRPLQSLLRFETVEGDIVRANVAR